MHGYCQIVVGVDFAKLVIKLSETCAFVKDLAKIDSEFSETCAAVEDFAKMLAKLAKNADRPQIAPTMHNCTTAAGSWGARETPSERASPKG